MPEAKDIVFEIWRLQERRCYYAMSAAGAGIGYALATVSPDLSLLETRIFLATVTLWSISFLSGFKVLSSLNHAMVISKQAHTDRQKIHPQNSEVHRILDNVIEQSAESVGRRIFQFKWIQMLSLIAGALAFVFIKVDVCAALSLTASTKS
ncbi:hypothetical protein [Celeribacter halophilus]|uniref:hypothetical protein n=1 Tax=Celeribacter halophilus TaxID=576117 RepID=UPI001C097F0E|nr:hypothetical protein [Celeribacter halophilus]MBU2891580.1 hypothetical protein [Celeribacter halophilus]MDO6509738.1 hypothetical protein [Celeribacter halophilus]